MSEPDVPPLAYSNLSPRPAGMFYRAASRVLPGVAQVRAQIEPFARDWERANAAALAAGPPGGPVWAVLGDSMSQGIGASRFDQGWVGQLGRDLAAAGYPLRIVNLSVTGARVADVLAGQLPAIERLRLSPELVTVLIGSNDLMRRGSRDLLPAEFGQLLAALPDGAVVASLPNPRPAAQAVNELIERAAGHGAPARHGAPAEQDGGPADAGGRLIVAELRSGGAQTWRGRLAPDHFHPNDLGYAGLAASFAGPVLTRLRQASRQPHP